MSFELQWIDRDRIEKPFAHVVSVYQNYWWVVNANGKVAVYETTQYGAHKSWSPMCNRDSNIVHKLLKKRNMPGATDVVQIPLAFLPHECDC